jgi:hypothetical protein
MMVSLSFYTDGMYLLLIFILYVIFIKIGRQLKGVLALFEGRTFWNVLLPNHPDK